MHVHCITYLGHLSLYSYLIFLCTHTIVKPLKLYRRNSQDTSVCALGFPLKGMIKLCFSAIQALCRSYHLCLAVILN